MRKTAVLYKLFSLSFLFFFHYYTVAQVFIETSPESLVSNPVDMGVRISGLGTLSDRVPYEKITGSPFWSDDWKPAILFGTNNRKWKCKARLNFATAEIHFLDRSGNELIAGEGLVKRLVFYKSNDTSSLEAVFLQYDRPITLNHESKYGFVQELNSGKYELLKLTKRNLSSADSLFGTLKRYYFDTEVHYFIQANDMLREIKKLDKENVLSNIPSSSSYSSWMKDHKINFKKETDVVEFLNYYNSQRNTKQ